MGKYFKVSLKGTIGAQEVWSVNPIFDPAGETTFDWNQAYADAITAAIGAITLTTTLRGAMSSSATLSSVRLELRDTDNDILYGVSEYQLATPIVGTGTASKTPQTAIVASLRTNTPGASGRGRLYWPALGLAIDGSTFRLTNSVAGLLATEMASYLKNIKTAILSTGAWAPWTDMQLVVFSRTKGITTPVVRVQVGNVLDTQRRRRDALPEQYQTAVYPSP